MDNVLVFEQKNNEFLIKLEKSDYQLAALWDIK